MMEGENMSFAESELMDNHSHDCKDCGTHVKNGRATSWESGFCPKCYEGKKNRRESEINPMKTVVSSAIINPMTLYLNRYTPGEMEKMK